MLKNNDDILNENNDKSSKNLIKKIFKYSWIEKNLLFFLFLSLLAVIYIANGHTADKLTRDNNKLENEIKDLQYQYKTVKSEVMYRSEEQQIIKEVQKMGLHINNEMPNRISNIKVDSTQ